MVDKMLIKSVNENFINMKFHQQNFQFVKICKWVNKQNNEMYSTSGFKNAICFHISNQLYANYYHLRLQHVQVLNFMIVIKLVIKTK
jgi:hypothetical protein